MASLEKGFVEEYLGAEKVLILVDAPTSKPKVASRLLESVDQLCRARTVARRCVVVPCGRRLDLVVAVQAKS